MAGTAVMGGGRAVPVDGGYRGHRPLAFWQRLPGERQILDGGQARRSHDGTSVYWRARCRLAAVHATDCARAAMDLMYRHGGSTSFQRESRLAECWRDLHVVGQTAALAPEWYPIGGRVLLKMAPGPRMR